MIDQKPKQNKIEMPNKRVVTETNPSTNWTEVKEKESATKYEFEDEESAEEDYYGEEQEQNYQLPRTTKIFVGGLPHNLDKEEFREYFEEFGEIADCVIMLDRETQKPRGFGFITFFQEEAVDSVMAIKDQHLLRGKWIDCKRAIPQNSSHMPQARSQGSSEKKQELGSVKCDHSNSRLEESGSQDQSKYDETPTNLEASLKQEEAAQVAIENLQRMYSDPNQTEIVKEIDQ